jgi:hypothetical protein
VRTLESVVLTELASATEEVEWRCSQSLLDITKYYWGVKWRRLRWQGHVTRAWRITNEYKILVGKSEGIRPPRKGSLHERLKWGLKVGLKGVEWIHLAEVRGPVACCYEHGNEPLAYRPWRDGNFRLATAISFSLCTNSTFRQLWILLIWHYAALWLIQSS